MAAPVRIATRARLYLAGTVTLALLVAFGAFWAAWSSYVVRQRTDELSRQVVALARGRAVADTLGREVNESLFRVQGRLIGAQLLIVDAEGRVLSTSSATTLERVPLDRLGVQDDRGVRTAVLGDRRALAVAAPVDSDQVLVALQDLSEIRSAQRGFLALALLAVAVAMLTAWVAGGFLGGRLTGPLERLREAAEDVAGGQWGAQVAVEGDAETSSLAASFNEMSSRVADVYEAQRAFVGDVSHEIRTPLTSIRGYADALLEGIISDDAGREHALSVIRTEADRIAETSSALLALSELDAGAVALAREPVDLAVVADALQGRFGAEAASAGRELVIELGSERPIADADRVLQAATILVDNALRHATTRVRVSAEAARGAWRLRVDDDGEGIAADQREAVFDRFRRIDSARSSQKGGAGLGLSICRRLVEAMGGSVWAEESPLGGARFVIELPPDA